LVRESSAFVVPNRSLDREFLATLSDARVANVLEECKSFTDHRLGNALSVRHVAEEVLRRPGLQARHEEAARIAARMSILSGGHRAEVVASLEQLRKYDGESKTIAAMLNAIKTPSTVQDFAQTVEIADL